jgi:hypothetical protein
MACWYERLAVAGAGFKRSVNAGNPRGMSNHGLCVDDGCKVNQNEIAAVDDVKTPAHTGNLKKMSNFGFIFIMGRVIPRNAACGVCLAHGRGVDNDGKAIARFSERLSISAIVLRLGLECDAFAPGRVGRKTKDEATDELCTNRFEAIQDRRKLRSLGGALLNDRSRSESESFLNDQQATV